MENYLWNWFKNTPHAKLMLKCKNSAKHKNKYHEEDNIFIHTKMVYKEVIKRYKNKVDSELFFILLMSAICHDIAKPLVRSVNDEGYAKFINHENVGFYQTLSLLKKYQLDGLNETCFRLTDDIITRVLNIVTRHNIYRYDNIKTVIERYYSQLPEVYMFSVCDVNGRVTKEKHDLTFISDILSNGAYERELQSYKDSLIPKKNRLVFLIGPPASGKTFLSKCLFMDNEYIRVLSRDDMIETIDFKELGLESDTNLTYNDKWDYLCKNGMQKDIDYLFLDRYKECIRNDIYTIVIDKTNTTRASRKAFLNPYFEEEDLKCKFETYSKEAYVLAIPPENILENAINRAKEGYKDVSREIINSFINKYENPDFSEFDKIHYVLHTDLTKYKQRLII